MNLDKTIQTYRANGKLMISGEYLVLRGSLSLSVPLSFGQSLTVREHSGTPALVWKTYVKGQPWFDAVFSLNGFIIGNTNDFPTAQYLRELLLAAESMNPGFLDKGKRYEIVSKVEFDMNWGFGSSSSLIVNLAAWAKVDPFVLFRRVSTGSGYDVATAMSQKPVVYMLNENKPEIRHVDFNPVFRDQLYFAYLGKKRNSTQAVNQFNENEERSYVSEIHEIDAITEEMIQTAELRNFRRLMHEHERIISGILGIPAIGEKFFNDLSGEVKSLGAWGGDFVMLASDMPKEYLISYLRKKDLNIWFGYDEIVLKQE